MSGEAWDAFWAENQDSSRGGCLSGRSPDLEREQRRFWEQFAIALPKDARVLDIATGNGVVLRWLSAARRDLKLTGIDLSRRLPAAPPRCDIRGGIAMEDLPFADHSFDAVISQFGVEYAEVPRATAEAARVIKPSGRLALITHRPDSAIVEHNVARRDGLRWALEEAGLPDKARGSVKLQQLGLGVVPELRSAPTVATRRFGAGSSAWEFAAAILQTLHGGARQPQAIQLQALSNLELRAVHEIQRIDSLEAASRAAADADAFRRVLAANGLRLDSERALTEGPGGRPFANGWVLSKDSAVAAEG